MAETDGRTPEARVLHTIRSAKTEARKARDTRMQRNRRNLDAYFGRQDWSHKQQGQSQEFLPKVPMAVEQFKAFVKRALVDFGDWFSVDMPDVAGIEAQDIRRFLRCKLETLSYTSDEKLDFATLITDGIHMGALESLMIFKIHGGIHTSQQFTVERGIEFLETPDGQQLRQTEDLVQRDIDEWRLHIDLISPTQWFPDPTTRGLYRIHGNIERDLHEIQALAEGPDAIYDPDVVAQIEADFAEKDEDARREQHRGQDETVNPDFRRRVVLDEYWGTLLRPDGSVAESNIVATIANDRFVIRPPEGNTFWHGQDPFVACPLIRVPLSVWHKALMDHAVELNLSLNELYNLMLDGGLAAVWGTRQLKKSWLDDPKQVDNGIPAGTTLIIKDEVPAGAKVLEQVATGQIPAEAMNMFTLSDREFNVAAITNDLKLGVLPQKSVKATEVVESQQGQAGMIDGILRDVEDRMIEPMLRKSWLTILQHFDQFSNTEIVRTMGRQAAFTMLQMSPAQRFATFANDCTFKVNGLSAVLARVRDFQKLLALMEVVKGNTLLLQSFIKKYSPDKILDRLFKTLNIDTESIQAEPEEQRALAQSLQAQGGQPGGGLVRPGVQEGAENPAPGALTQPGVEQLELGV